MSNKFNPLEKSVQKQSTLHVSENEQRYKVRERERERPYPFYSSFFTNYLFTVGTTRAVAGSAAKFVTIDRDYVLASAKAALNKTLTQRVIYCSAATANSKSRILYSQSKGLTEDGLGESVRFAKLSRLESVKCQYIATD